jgi:hypothetical protein
VQYADIARAIAKAQAVTGHPMFYSICDWGSNSPWTWAPGIGGVSADIWRTSGDIVAPIVAGTPNSSRRATFAGVLTNFDQGIHPQAQHTGFYNDSDMMLVGMPGLSEAENRVHMSLWAISAAPLIEGADLAKLDNSTKAILTNPEVIAVDQDPLGVQAIKVAEPKPGLQVWTKPLAATGAHAVLLLNRTSAPATIEANWKEIGLDASSPALVRDLWTGKETEQHSPNYAATISGGDAALLMIRGSDAKATRYEPSSSANEVPRVSATEPCLACSVGQNVSNQGEKNQKFNIPILAGTRFIQIFYSNRSKNPVTAKLRVDGKIPSNVLFPPTSEEEPVASVMIAVVAEQSETESALSFAFPDASGLALVSLSVLPGGQE